MLYINFLTFFLTKNVIKGLTKQILHYLTFFCLSLFGTAYQKTCRSSSKSTTFIIKIFYQKNISLSLVRVPMRYILFLFLDARRRFLIFVCRRKTKHKNMKKNYAFVYLYTTVDKLFIA